MSPSGLGMGFSFFPINKSYRPFQFWNLGIIELPPRILFFIRAHRGIFLLDTMEKIFRPVKIKSNTGALRFDTDVALYLVNIEFKRIDRLKESFWISLVFLHVTPNDR